MVTKHPFITVHGPIILVKKIVKNKKALAFENYLESVSFIVSSNVKQYFIVLYCLLKLHMVKVHDGSYYHCYYNGNRLFGI